MTRSLQEFLSSLSQRRECVFKHANQEMQTLKLSVPFTHPEHKHGVFSTPTSTVKG